MCEFRQRLVHRLAGCAHQLGDLFLREIVVHAQRATFLGAETVRQLQQRLGHAAGDIRENQVGE